MDAAEESRRAEEEGMRHSYVGDVGDFGKYGLLRTFCGSPGQHRLGVVWYLTDAQEHNNDGKHDGYLKRGSSSYRQSFRNCDPELYDRMRNIRQENQLDIAQVMDGSVLPATTAYFDEPLPVFSGYAGPKNRIERWQVRGEWHKEAMRKTAGADFIFTDPDNGILFSTKEEAKTKKPDHKYTYWHEILDYLERGQSVIAYHHLGRQKGGHASLISKCLETIREFVPVVWAIRYRRGTARAFFVIPATKHHEWLRTSSNVFVQNWSKHADIFE